MFIAENKRLNPRRSEEREVSGRYRASYFPLLRTAPEVRATVGYKHVTPAGVKPAATCRVQEASGQRCWWRPRCAVYPALKIALTSG